MLHFLPVSMGVSALLGAGCWWAVRHRKASAPTPLKSSPISSQKGTGGVDVTDLGYGAIQVESKAYPQSKTPANLDDVNDAFQAKNQDWVALHVMAPQGQPFGGYELLQALLNAGLEYREDRLFHHSQQHDPRRLSLFSVANAVHPGVFDLENMGAVRSPGLLLIMQPALCEHPVMGCFEVFLSTARHLAEELGGVLCDERRQPLTEKTIDHMRQLLSPSLAEV